MRNTLILVFFLLITNTIEAQRVKVKYKRMPSSMEMVDSLFSLGSEAYSSLMNKHVAESGALRMSDSEGVLIIELAMSDKGSVSAKFMTKLDEHLEASFTQYLKRYASYWQFYGEPYKVYLLFAVGRDYYRLNNLQGNLEDFPERFLPPYAPPVSMYIFKSAPYRIRFKRDESDPRTAEEIAEEKLDQMRREGKLSEPRMRRPNITESITLEVYQKELDKYLELKEKGKTRRALRSLNMLIAFNPFDMELLQDRVRMEKELGKSEYQSYDIPWIVALRKMQAKGSLAR